VPKLHFNTPKLHFYTPGNHFTACKNHPNASKDRLEKPYFDENTRKTQKTCNWENVTLPVAPFRVSRNGKQDVAVR
jgi:hypothetical protein